VFTGRPDHDDDEDDFDGVAPRLLCCFVCQWAGAEDLRPTGTTWARQRNSCAGQKAKALDDEVLRASLRSMRW